MQTVSNEFKQMCKSNTPSGAIGRIVVTEDDITIAENTDIQDITIEDNCYINDKFVGTTVAKKVTVNLFNDDNIYDLENKEIEVKLGFDLDGTEELISFGNYVIEKPETEEVQAKTNFIGYDYMIKFNKLYVDTNEYPISLADYFTNLCNQVGVEVGNIDFVNSDYMVQGNAFTNNEDCRTVLSAIAQIAGGIAKIGRDNKAYIINLSAGDVLEEIDGNNYDTFTPNKIFGPINKVVLRMNSGVDGEESVRPDEESITQNGECAIVIADNPILNTAEQRELVIDNIFNALNGITYLPYKTTYYGYPYVDSTDKIKMLNVNDTEYNSYIFNHTINYDGTFSGSIDTSALTKAQSMYKNTLDLKTRFKRTELAVDKINGKISSIVEEQEGTQNQINSIIQDANSTTERIGDIENETNSKIEELKVSIDGVSNKITQNGGNNIFYYDKEFWQGGTVEEIIRRNIQVGDDLSGKKLVFNFPVGVNLGEEASANIIVGTGNNYIAVEQGTDLTTYDEVQKILVKQGISKATVYNYDVTTSEIINNYKEYTLSDDFGAVTSIDTSISAYQYIQVEEIKTRTELNLQEETGDIRNNSVSGMGYIVNKGSSYQTIEGLQNGTYTVSFKYKKTGPELTNVSIRINGEEYPLTETDWEEFVQTIEVNSNYITIELISDTDNALYITDILGNLGTEKDVWTQNPNETRTDTVTIGKGIKVESTASKTYTKIDADGTRVFNSDNDELVAQFTENGIDVKDIKVKGQAEILGMLIKQVGNQTWISSLL